MTLLFKDNEWDAELIEKLWKEVDKVGQELGLTYFPPQIEIISAEQMLDNYSTFALPVMYPHWSLGKSFIQNERAYKAGNINLAYEVVINTNPSICYIMDSNTATMQTLVLAHAAVGHSSFFKNNYLFKYWTEPETIIPFLQYAKKFILECEVRYGKRPVESILDAAHAVMFNGVDHYKKPLPKTAKQQREILANRIKVSEEGRDKLFDQLLQISSKPVQTKVFRECDENILKYIEQRSRSLSGWQRKILSIVRHLAQYLWPNLQTHMMNEGWASFCHYNIMNQLYDKKKLSEASMLEFIHSHTAVVNSQEAIKHVRFFDKDVAIFNQGNAHINAYKLGYSIFTDIRRMCENPTEEDKTWFPDIVNTDWKETCFNAMANYRDDTFIEKFLSPKVMRDMGLVLLGYAKNERDEDGNASHTYKVAAIHNEDGYKEIRRELAKEYSLSNKIPEILVVPPKTQQDGILQLFYEHPTTKLDRASAKSTMYYLECLWGNRVRLRQRVGDEDIEII